MGICNKLLFLIIFGVVGLGFYFHFISNQEIKIDENGWYGSGSPRADDTKVTPFKITVPEDVLKDLKTRLNNSRISHLPLEDSDDFYYGFNSNYLKTVKDYWLTKYNWRKHEAELNKFPQFITEVEGMKIHFIRSKPAPKYKTVYPIIVVHGWPGCVQEFVKFIPLLNDPKAHGIDVDFAFEVIAPSIPGYGWSESPKKTGFSQVECARVFNKLMKRLGFQKYYLQGGDWGSVVTAHMAQLFSENSLGLHLNMMMVSPMDSPIAFLYTLAGSFFPKMLFSSEKHHNFSYGSYFLEIIKESGYMHIQATKPDTVGTALNDSPIGLAAYILEKFSTWTNAEYRGLKDGGLTKKFTMDELLTIVTIYWTNGNIVNSQRFYREFFIDQRNEQLQRKFLNVPTAHSQFGNEMFDKTPLEIAKTSINIQFQKEHPVGGHFAAYEEPKLLAEDTFAFVKQLTQQKPKTKEEF